MGCRKIVCIGLNYRDHAAEIGATVPPEPIVFFKATNTITGPGDPIRKPRGSTKVDWEVELAVVIGKPAHNLDNEVEAESTIAGFAISNDVSARDFQLERGGQWVKGKSCPTFNPLGPVLVPRSLVSPDDLDLRLEVNGVRRQRSNTSQLAFGVNHLVWYLSQFMRLDPGDIINTGTPGGVGMSAEPPRFLVPGDVVDLEIDGLGRQQSIVIDEGGTS